MSNVFAAFSSHARQEIRWRRGALALCALLIVVGLGFILRHAIGNRSRNAWVPASGARLAEIDSSFNAIADGDRDTPRDSWDPDYVVSKLGRDPQVLFEWVRRNTFWIPYRGTLRGPVGVLLDRQGNSLDRALLLATLLDKAGHKVRLAHGTMSRDRAVALLPPLVALRAVAFLPVASARATLPDLRPMAAEYHLDGAALQQRVSQQEQALTNVAAALDRRVTDQTKRLWDALPLHKQLPGADSRFAKALEALQDHWWVQRWDENHWSDLDLVGDSRTNGNTAGAITTVTDTLTLDQLASAPLHHEIVVRVIGEQSAGGALTEHTTLEYVLRPADVIGKPVALQFWPLEWAADSEHNSTPKGKLRPAILDLHAWATTLIVGNGAVATTALLDNGDDINKPMRGGPMAGLASAFQTTVHAAPAHELSAVWLEYEIRVPGETPRRIRRTVFDLLGPARRASRPRALVMDDDKRFARGLALMMRTELLPVASGFSAEFVRHLAAQSVLGNRQLLREAMRGTLPKDALTRDSLLSHGAPFLSPLYSLAVARLQWSRDAGVIYIDRPDLLTRHIYSAPSGTNIELHDATDIVANEVGVSLNARDAKRVRLAEGVLETNAESMLRMTMIASDNAGDAYNNSRDWVAIEPQDTATARKLELPDDVRQRVRDELTSGRIVVAPRAPVIMTRESFAGWWAMDPETGNTLGFGANGWGQDAPEYAFLIAQRQLAAYSFRQFMLRFALGFAQTYVFCWELNDIGMLGTMNADQAFSASVTKSLDECTTQSLVWGGVSAVAPIVFLTWKYRAAVAAQAERLAAEGLAAEGAAAGGGEAPGLGGVGGGGGAPGEGPAISPGATSVPPGPAAPPELPGMSEPSAPSEPGAPEAPAPTTGPTPEDVEAARRARDLALKQFAEATTNEVGYESGWPGAQSGRGGAYDPAVAEQATQAAEDARNAYYQAEQNYQNLVDQYRAANGGAFPPVTNGVPGVPGEPAPAAAGPGAPGGSAPAPSGPPVTPGPDGQVRVGQAAGANPFNTTSVGGNPYGQTQVGNDVLGQTQVGTNSPGLPQAGANPLGQTQPGANPFGNPLSTTSTNPLARTLGGQAGLGGGVPK